MAIHSTYQSNYFELLVWKTTESQDFFVDNLQLSYTQQQQIQQQYTHPIAFMQWLSSRYCLQQLFGLSYQNFQKNQLGKLELPNHNWHLSISHSDEYTAVVKSRGPIGVDIQVFNTKLQRIASKYIDPQTLIELQKTPYYNDYLHLYWGIKEALFKAYGLGKLDYIQHLHVQIFEIGEKGRTSATIIKEDFKQDYEVYYQKTEDYYLCVVTKKSF